MGIVDSDPPEGLTLPNLTTLFSQYAALKWKQNGGPQMKPDAEVNMKYYSPQSTEGEAPNVSLQLYDHAVPGTSYHGHNP